MRRGVLVSAAVLLVLGCSLREISYDAVEPTLNECAEDADCGDDGRCTAEERCEATTDGEFGTVLFEVTAPGTNTSEEFAGISFLTLREDVPPAGGTLNLALGDVIDVLGTVTLPPVDRTEPCVHDLEAVPLRVRLAPTERLLGLPASVYSTPAVGERRGCRYGKGD